MLFHKTFWFIRAMRSNVLHKQKQFRSTPHRALHAADFFCFFFAVFFKFLLSKSRYKIYVKIRAKVDEIPCACNETYESTKWIQWFIDDKRDWYSSSIALSNYQFAYMIFLLFLNKNRYFDCFVFIVMWMNLLLFI